MRFSIRDLLLSTAVVALALGWVLDHRRLSISNLIGEGFPEITISINHPEVNPGTTIQVRSWIDDAKDRLRQTSICNYTIRRVGFYHRGLKGMIVIPESGDIVNWEDEAFRGLEDSVGRGRYTFEEGTKIGFEDEAEPLRLGIYLIERKWNCDYEQADGTTKEIWLKSAPVLLYVTPYDKDGKLIDKFVQSEKYRSFHEIQLQEYWEQQSRSTRKQ